MNEPVQLLKVSDVANILQITRNEVYQLLESGTLRGIRWSGKPRGHWRVHPADLAEFIDRQRKEAA